MSEGISIRYITKSQLDAEVDEWLAEMREVFTLSHLYATDPDELRAEVEAMTWQVRDIALLLQGMYPDG